MSTPLILTPSSLRNNSQPATTRLVNALTTLVGLLALAIGAGAFTLSYDALLAVDLAAGQPAAKAWIWPLLIDAPLVVFTLALLTFQVMRQGIKLWAGLVILYTAATVAFNLSHAPATVLGRTAAIVAPIGLLLTTEALRHLARTIIERQAVITNITELRNRAAALAADLDTRRQGGAVELEALARSIAAQQAKLAELKAEVKEESRGKFAATIQEMNARRQEKIDQRRARVLEMLPQFGSRQELAAALGISEKTLRGDIKALNGRMAEVRE